jgi:hypothetical protein
MLLEVKSGVAGGAPPRGKRNEKRLLGAGLLVSNKELSPILAPAPSSP